MTTEDIRHALKSEPFRPFILHTTDGRALPVPHPRFVLIVTGGETVVVASAVDDHFAIVGLPYLARLEVPANGLANYNPESTQKPT